MNRLSIQHSSEEIVGFVGELVWYDEDLFVISDRDYSSHTISLTRIRVEHDRKAPYLFRVKESDKKLSKFFGTIHMLKG